MKLKLRMQCATCKSSDVLADAYAEWSEKRQCWDLSQTFDKGAWCNDCNGESRIEEVEITEETMKS